MRTETPTQRRRNFDPAQLLVNLNLSAKVWLVLFLIQTLALLLALARDYLPRKTATAGIFAIDQTGRPYPIREIGFGQATNLHVFYAELATHALLNRGPLDFDQPDLLQFLFSPAATADAIKLRDRQTPAYRAKELHQKAEASTFRFASSTGERVFVSILGQVIRIGLFEGQPVTEVDHFQLDFVLAYNPNLALNGRFPVVVTHFKYESSPR